MRRIAAFQAIYYCATGIWPLLHMPSFELVAGRKREHWLVKTVGVVVTAIGTGVGIAAARRELTPSMRALAAMAAIGLAGIDVRYAVSGRIRRVYLADAAIEIAVALLWVRSLLRDHERGTNAYSDAAAASENATMAASARSRSARAGTARGTSGSRRSG